MSEKTFFEENENKIDKIYIYKKSVKSARFKEISMNMWPRFADYLFLQSAKPTCKACDLT